MKPESKIYVAGHRGLVGSSLVRTLQRKGHRNLVLRSHAELELTDRRAVEQFFRDERPEYVFLAAARSAASWPTTPTPPNSSATTSRSTSTSFTRPGVMA